MNISIIILSFIVCISMSGLLYTALYLALNLEFNDSNSAFFARVISFLVGIESFIDLMLVCLIH